MIGFVAIASLILGGMTQAVTAQGNFWLGFLAAFILTFTVGSALLYFWVKAGRGKALAWMMVIAFLIRLFLGIFLNWGLPRFGYDTAPQRAGFVFEDAYRRDENAWALAQSGDSALRAFSDEYGTDQYGGMLALSALVYRVLSPDTYRPILIVILAAGAMALSLPFLVAAVERQFSFRLALIAGWILALYPEGVLLGAAQMREPFLISFLCVLIWSASHWIDRSRLKLTLSAAFVSTGLFFLFSYRVTIMAVAGVLIWVLVEELAATSSRWIKLAGVVVAAIAGAAALFIFRDWFLESLQWDVNRTVLQSGVVQFQLEKLPQFLHFPFVLVYGLLQPVLPAAIAAPAPWIWKSLGIFRSVGWYALLPLLIYAVFRIWKVYPARNRRWLAVILGVVWVWILISSARAGGDQWDNPRYRTIFLPWMAMISAWAIHYARATKDRWLRRTYLVLLVFLGFFTEWYISRYYPVIPRLDFALMIILIFSISLTIFAGGWIRDRKSLQKKDSLATDKNPKNGMQS